MQGSDCSVDLLAKTEAAAVAAADALSPSAEAAAFAAAVAVDSAGTASHTLGCSSKRNRWQISHCDDIMSSGYTALCWVKSPFPILDQGLQLQFLPSVSCHGVQFDIKNCLLVSTVCKPYLSASVRHRDQGLQVTGPQINPPAAGLGVWTWCPWGSHQQHSCLQRT
jgi:hypothetical protein